MRRLIIGLSILVSSFRYAAADQQVVGGQWRGLNNGDASIQIGDNEAQDLLNVDVTEAAYGIRKRSGYDLFRTIGVSTSGVRGGYSFRDASGSDLLIHANDRAIYKSANGGAYSAFLTTNTLGAYYDFTDSNGALFFANSSRDPIGRYTGSVLSLLSGAPAGTQVEALPDRLAISGTSANPNRVHFSQSADFTNFTIGLEEADPFTEDLGLTGQAINAIKWADDRLLLFTKTSLSYWAGSNQYDGVIEEVSNTIGSVQPSSIVRDLGVTYFQAQDGHFYAYDNNSLTWISRAIAGTVDALASGESKNWQLSSQADFGAGTFSAGLSSTTSPGDVAYAVQTLDDSSFGTLSWAQSRTTTASSVAGASVSFSASGLRLSVESSNASETIAAIASTTFASPLSTGTWRFNFTNNLSGTAGVSDVFITEYRLYVDGASDGTTNRVMALLQCSGVSPTTAVIQFYQDTTLIASDGVNSSYCTGTSGYLKMRRNSSDGWTISLNDSATDLAAGSVTISSYTVFSKMYIRAYLSKGLGSTLTSASAQLSSIQFYPSSATYQSVNFNVGGAITSWNAFTANQSLGNGAISYALYTDTNTTMTIASASTWVSSQTITSGSVPTVGTATYVALVYAFSVEASTNTPTVNDTEVTWNEGTLTRTWASVDKDHRIIWSVAESTYSVPNISLIYDPRFNTWLKYSFPFDASARVGTKLFFGNPSSGNVYSWPGSNSDNGAAFNAFWKSKDFIGTDLFVEKDYSGLSLVAKTQTGSNLDLAYTVNTSSTVSSNISLSDTNSNTLRRYNSNLASGKFGTFFSFRFGNDDADAPFEVYAVKFDYKPRPWRVLP